jgi:hypothetical protein
MPYKDPQKRKEVSKKASAKYYQNNKAATLKRSKANRIKYKKIWAEFRSKIECAACGFAHPAAMDFHHTDPSNKLGAVHHFVRNKAWKKAYAEASKCIVLCANCHRVHHYELLQAKKLQDGDLHSDIPFINEAP